MSKTKYDCVFRVKRVSQDRPRVGMPDAVRPGDLLTYFDSRKAYTTRTVASVHKGHVVVAPLVYNGYQLDEAHKVDFDDMYEALRPLEPVPEQAPEPEPVPAPEPVSEPPPAVGVKSVLDFLMESDEESNQ